VRHERLSVSRVGANQVHVRGGRPGSKALSRLAAWLAGRPEVRAVQQRATGIVEAELRDGAVLAALISTLEDQIFQLQRPAPPRRCVTVVHVLPGRCRLAVEGVSDDGILRLAAYLEGQKGVLRVTASPAARSIVVVHEEGAVRPESLARLAAESDAASWPAPAALPTHTPWGSAVAATAVLGASLTGVVPPAALAAGIALTTVPPARRALRALTERRLSVDVLDVLAVGISVGTGQPGTAAFITWLLSVGDLLLARSADSARAAISRLVKLDAPEAWRVHGKKVEKVPATKLVRGDLVLVPTGQRVPADGTVVSGSASVDEKALTGESMPRALAPGERVLAATVVLEGEVHITVERAGRDTTAAKIVQRLEGAGQKPMTLVRNAERVTDRLTLPTLGLAGAAAGVTGEVTRMASVLITDFGTGVRIALPTSALVAMALAARAGVLVKGAQYLERLARTDVVIFDKTGTLTEGTPEITEVVPLDGVPEHRVLALCAAAEAQAAHPLAEAIRRHAAHVGVPTLHAELGSSRYAIGLGLAAHVEGEEVLVGNRRWMRQHGVDVGAAEPRLEALRQRGASSVLVATRGALRGLLSYADRPRAESAAVVQALHKSGRRVVLLSGDARASVEAVARQLGIDEAHGELLPEDKATHVQNLRRSGKVVAVVGDGINDAPALALADVGISLSGSSDVALETADVVLQRGGLRGLPGAFKAGERAVRHVERGLALVLVPNAIGIVLGALGLIGPAVAAIANNGSTVAAALAALAPLLVPAKETPP
jgi:Cu2+-exporting ATPase